MKYTIINIVLSVITGVIGKMLIEQEGLQVGIIYILSMFLAIALMITTNNMVRCDIKDNSKKRTI